MSRIFAALIVALIAFDCFAGESQIFSPASRQDLTGVFGGQCFDCIPPTADPTCAPGFLPACKQENGFCRKHAFTSLTVRYCKTVADGTGFQGCMAYDPQTCVTVNTCTQCAAPNPCTNCGPDSTEEKPTKCTIVPYAFCPPVGG